MQQKLSLSTSGRCILRIDACGNKHVKSFTKRDNFFKPLTKRNEKCSREKQFNQQSSPQSSTSAQQTSVQQTLNSNIVAKSATIAESIWALKSVVSGCSNSSWDDIVNTLKAICPDS